MRILAVETSSPPGSIAVSVGGDVQMERFASARRTTETFAVAIEQLLKQASLKPKEIDLVATTFGPGSFTGIRIGITAAKVFAHAVGARIVATNTLEVIARQVPAEGEIEAVLDAQRGELFVARFRREADSFAEVIPTQIISAEKWIATRTKDATLIGTGLRKIREQLLDGATTADETLWEPSAKTLALLAEEQLETGDETNPIELVPQYFRRSAAEEKADQTGTPQPKRE